MSWDEIFQLSSFVSTAVIEDFCFSILEDPSAAIKRKNSELHSKLKEMHQDWEKFLKTPTVFKL